MFEPLSRVLVHYKSIYSCNYTSNPLPGGHSEQRHRLLSVGHRAASYDDAEWPQGRALQKHLGLRREDHQVGGHRRHVQGCAEQHLPRHGRCTGAGAVRRDQKVHLERSGGQL